MIDPYSSETIGYHLFLEPTGALAEVLGGVIQTLATEYGGPVFSPHVTLLARIPAENEDVVIKKTEKLAASISPFSLTLGEFALEDRYFRALYLVIKEVDDMRMRHTNAGHIFSMENEDVYNPHLSVLYGNYPEETKRATVSALRSLQGLSFLVGKIHLYKTEGEVLAWRKVREFGLE